MLLPDVVKEEFPAIDLPDRFLPLVVEPPDVGRDVGEETANPLFVVRCPALLAVLAAIRP